MSIVPQPACHGMGNNAHMPEEELREATKRSVSTQDLSWLIEHSRLQRLDLDPPYQRRSVWTPRDRRSFMDTVFKNYPSPPIYLHKTIDLDTGNAMYHVVDGKQRISTVLDFLNNKVYLPHEFGDARFDGKRWRDLADDDTARSTLWNYQIIVEQIDDVSPTFVREVFERLNKNSRKLTAQELRHARFDGWLITFLEDELAQPVWKRFKIQTTGKEKRMTDVQNLAELAMVIARSDVTGFDQVDLDEFFALLDDVEEESLDFDEETFTRGFHATRDFLDQLDETVKLGEPPEVGQPDKRPGVVAGLAQPFMHFYTLWAYVDSIVSDFGHGQFEDLGVAWLRQDFGQRYQRFMEAVQSFDLASLEAHWETEGKDFDGLVEAYKAASVGATTDLPQRRARLVALQAAMELVEPDSD